MIDAFAMIAQCARGQGAVAGFLCARCGERAGTPMTDSRVPDKTCSTCAIKLEGGVPCRKVVDVKRDTKRDTTRALMFHVEQCLSDSPDLFDGSAGQELRRRETERLQEGETWLRKHQFHGRQWMEAWPSEARTIYGCECGGRLFSPWIQVKVTP